MPFIRGKYIKPLSAVGTLGDFGHVYTVEEYVWGKFERGLALPYVQSISMERSPNVDFAWTLGDWPIRDHTGLRGATITISGRSGTSHRMGYTREGENKFASGPVLFHELQAFFDQYQLSATEDLKTGNDVLQEAGDNYERRKLLFRAVYENKMFWAEVDNFSWSRNTSSSRFGYEYSLRLKVYAQGELRNDFNVFGSGPGRFGGYMDMASGYVELANRITQATHAQLRGLVLGPIRSLGRTLASVSRLASTTRGVADLPAEAVGMLVDVASRGVMTAQSMIRALPFSERLEISTRKDFYDIASAMGTARRFLIFVFGRYDYNILNNPELSRDPGYLSYKQRPSAKAPQDGQRVPYTLSDGDTLETVAQDWYGNTSMASKLAEINGLIDWWTNADGSPLGPGNTIWLPSSGERGVDANLVTDPTEPYGLDLLLAPDGDLVPNGDKGDDFMLVGGSRLIEQAMTVRLRTFQGEHQVFPDYGLPGIIGDKGVLEITGTLVSKSRQQFLDDPRIKSIASMTVMDGGDVFDIRCSLVAAGGEVINVTVPVN